MRSQPKPKPKPKTHFSIHFPILYKLISLSLFALLFYHIRFAELKYPEVVLEETHVISMVQHFINPNL